MKECMLNMSIHNKYTYSSCIRGGNNANYSI